MADTPSVLSPGVLVAETYEVDRLLGKGGMGEVWLAKHRRLPGKEVAVKVLKLGGADANAEVLARFKREAEIAAKLAHPNIVQVLDYNTLPSGDPYLVMELLKGESLAARLRGPMSPEALKQLMKQVGAALEAAHALGVVHRDLKPENIFLVPTALGDQVKVLDFGISKVADSNTVQTTDSVLVGTPLYMSPEQALGNNSEVSPQSDVFSLASICYELLCGEAPFFADNIAKVVFRIAYEPPRPLRERNPSVPPEMAFAIDHALVKDKAKRTPDVRTFVQELTGEVLPDLAREAVVDTTSGVFTPGMKVSESMAGGETVSPSQAGRKLVTPAPATPQPSSPTPSAPAVSSASSAPAPLHPTAMGSRRASLFVGMGVIFSLVGVGLVTMVVRAKGPTMTDTDTFSLPPVVDAGARVAEPLDAGAAPEVVGTADAGVAGVVVKDPAVKPPVRPVHEEKLSDAEKALVAELRGDLDELTNAQQAMRKGLSVLSQVESTPAKREVLLLQLKAVCRLHDLGSTTSTMNKLESVAPGAASRGKETCRQQWGAGSPF